VVEDAPRAHVTGMSGLLPTAGRLLTCHCVRPLLQAGQRRVEAHGRWAGTAAAAGGGGGGCASLEHIWSSCLEAVCKPVGTCRYGLAVYRVTMQVHGVALAAAQAFRRDQAQPFDGVPGKRDHTSGRVLMDWRGWPGCAGHVMHKGGWGGGHTAMASPCASRAPPAAADSPLTLASGSLGCGHL
jgi:hypothetical protein